MTTYKFPHVTAWILTVMVLAACSSPTTAVVTYSGGTLYTSFTVSGVLTQVESGGSFRLWHRMGLMNIKIKSHL